MCISSAFHNDDLTCIQMMNPFTFGLNTCCLVILSQEKWSTAQEVICFICVQLQQHKCVWIRKKMWLVSMSSNKFFSPEKHFRYQKIHRMSVGTSKRCTHSQTRAHTYTFAYRYTHSCSFFAFYRIVWNNRSQELMASRVETNGDVWDAGHMNLHILVLIL